MFRFIIFKIPVTVQPWFWLVLAFVSGRIFADSVRDIVFLLLFLVAGFVSVLVHELGHALTAKHFGQNRKILLHGMGGLAIYTGGRHLSRPQDFAMIAAGPGFQLVLGLLAFVALKFFPHLPTSADYLLWAIKTISILWALVNLLPIYPLDGGQLLDATLGPERKRTTLAVSVGTGAAVCLYCLLVLRAPLFGILAAYLALESYKALRQPSWR